MKVHFVNGIKQNKKKMGSIFAIFFMLLFVFCGTWTDNRALTALPAQDVFAANNNIAFDEEIFFAEMAWPVPDFYTIAAPYGWRYDGGDFHTGMDIGGKGIEGVAVIAAQAGTVVEAVHSYAGYGRYIIIDHGNGITTLYAHLSEMLVESGDTMEIGQIIGRVGKSGNAADYALHFEIRKNGVANDPYLVLCETEARTNRAAELAIG